MAFYNVVIPEIEVCDVNLETSYWSVSFPLTAVAGLITSFTHGRDPLLIKNWKVGVLVHEYSPYLGHSKNPNALCVGGGSAPAVDKIINAPIIQEIKGRVKFSLYLSLTLDEYTEVEQNKLRQGFLRKSFAGGNITGFGDSETAFEPVDDKDLLPRLQSLPAGWWIKDRSDLLVGKEGSEKMETFFEALGLVQEEPEHPEKDKKTKQVYSKHTPGWFFGTCTGFQLLEPPCEREGRRTDEVLHSFVEPVHSLAELVFSRTLLRKAEYKIDEFSNSNCLWRWTSNPKSGATMLSAQS